MKECVADAKIVVGGKAVVIGSVLGLEKWRRGEFRSV
jgi:hypothetical protein